MATILGIETSCDETAAAVVEGGRRIRSNVISSQVDLHRKYGGVVPELASRAHIERIVPVVREARERAEISYDELDAIAVTRGPGLIGALLVGVNYAKALAASLGKPLIGVNHLEGHIHACLLDAAGSEGNPAEAEFPAVALVVSGGHTSLYRVDKKDRAGKKAAPNGFPYEYTQLGRTLDDAAGEAYDKVAKLLGLGYPGGPVIDRLAPQGDPKAFRFSRPKIKSGRQFDFSFSGIKAAVARLAEKEGLGGRSPEQPPAQVALDLVASFQRSVVEELTEKTMAAAIEHGVRTVFVTGGVAANSQLRSSISSRCEGAGLRCAIPPRELSTDNAAMIAAAAHPHLLAEDTAGSELDAMATFHL